MSRTEDQGRTWIHHGAGDRMYVHSIAVRNGIVWAGTEEGICKSDDYGRSWTTYDSEHGLPAYHMDRSRNHIYVSAVCAVDDDEIWLGCRNIERTETMALSLNGGRSWKARGLYGDKKEMEIATIIHHGDSIWVATPGTRMYSTRTHPIPRFGGLFRTDDKGSTWHKYDSSSGLSGDIVVFAFRQGDRLYAITDKGIDLTADFGRTWSRFAPDQFADLDFLRFPSRGFAASGREVALISNKMLHMTWDGGKTWSGFDLIKIANKYGEATSLNDVVIVEGRVWVGVTLRGEKDQPGGGVMKSTDRGENWDVYTMDHGVGGYVYALAVEGEG